MALTASEIQATGAVRDLNSRAVVMTFLTAGATRVNGMLRDPDGRMVVRR